MNAVFLGAAFAASLFIKTAPGEAFNIFLMLSICALAFGEPRIILPAIVWLGAVLLSGIISPGNYAVMCSLVLLPLVSISASRKAIIPFGAVLSVLALSLIGQKLLWPPELYPFPGRASWPFEDPNNAGTLMAVALVSAFVWFIQSKERLAFALSTLFLFALITTESRGACLGAGVGIATYLAVSFPKLRTVFLGSVLAGFGVLMCFESAQRAAGEHFAIWETSLPLISWDGAGIGRFKALYDTFRTETSSAGMFAHNDLLQFAIEMGLPFALLFLGLAVFIGLKTTRKNAGAACVLLAVFVHSLFNYPFYLPAVSLICGLALRIHDEKSA